MSVDRPPGRFNAVRRQYIWTTVKKGPTEIGYAYFRARRRRRNIADDEALLTESDKLALSGAFDASDATLQANRELLDRYLALDSFQPRRIIWFVPHFGHVYFGGVYTLLRFADHFAQNKGVETHIHFFDVGDGPLPTLSRKVRQAFPALAGATFTSAATPLRDLPDSDAVVASMWSSAYPVLHVMNTRAKFYFVQDNEPQFYAAGAASAMAEETYRFGFPGIVNTPGLGEVYGSYGNPVVSFVPAVDQHRYHPADEPHDPAAPVRVFFYARSQTARNSFGLGIASLAKLKRDYEERVEIICAGEDWNPAQFGLLGRITNVGRLGSLEAVAELYRSCDIGLVFMQTKHPSYQPFEFMASGMATVTNINPATEWLLRHEHNCLLTPPLPTPTAERLGRLVDDPELRRSIARTGLELVRGYRWEDQIERVWSAIAAPSSWASAGAPTAPRRSSEPSA